MIAVDGLVGIALDGVSAEVLMRFVAIINPVVLFLIVHSLVNS